MLRPLQRMKRRNESNDSEAGGFRIQPKLNSSDKEEPSSGTTKHYSHLKLAPPQSMLASNVKSDDSHMNKLVMPTEPEFIDSDSPNAKA